MKSKSEEFFELYACNLRERIYGLPEENSIMKFEKEIS